MKEATGYNKGEFIEVTCPHCGSENHIDITESTRKAYLSDTGGEMTCPHCMEVFLILPYW